MRHILIVLYLCKNRVEYDAYRTDLELLAQDAKNDGSNAARLEEAQTNYDQHKHNFEKLRSDVSVKLKFLDENRVNITCLCCLIRLDVEMLKLIIDLLN